MLGSWLRDSGFQFKGLESTDLKVIVDALEPKHASQGQTVITQGRDGSHLYLVSSGKYKCQKDGKFIKWY